MRDYVTRDTAGRQDGEKSAPNIFSFILMILHLDAAPMTLLLSPFMPITDFPTLIIAYL